MGRVSLTDRRGVNAFEGFVLNTLGWIFREQPIVDVGIDAHIEQMFNGDPTGKHLAVQIKTGLSNVHVNKNGDFDYYMSRTHYNYWLSYSVPVIIVLYDPDRQVLYWGAIFKRNTTKTKEGNHKITLKKKSVCTRETISDFNEIITLYESKSFIETMPSTMDEEELINYCSELFSHCSESLQIIRKYIEKLDEDYNRGTEQMQNFLSANTVGVTKEMADKEIKKASRLFTLALNACRMRISNELPLMVNVFIEAFQFIEYLLLEANNSEFEVLRDFIIKELSLQKKSIDSLINTTEDVVSQFCNSEKWTLELGQAQTLFSKVFEDYRIELIDLSGLLKSLTERFKQCNT